METWTLPPHMKSLRGQTVKNFGYDNQNFINYSFNSQGFRSDEFDLSQRKLIVFGGSTSFGMGVDQSLTFATQLASTLDLSLHNLSFGCYLHENHDYLENLKIMARLDCDDVFLIQINNADRRRISQDTVIRNNSEDFCVSRVVDFFEQANDILKYKTKIFLYWDDKNHNIPKTITKQFLLHNHFHLDHSIPARPGSFGPKSHNFIFKTIHSRLSSHRVALRLIS